MAGFARGALCLCSHLLHCTKVRKVRLCTMVRDTHALGSVCFHGDAPRWLRLCETVPAEEEREFAGRLQDCGPPRQVLRLLGGHGVVSAAMAAAALRRLADTERVEHAALWQDGRVASLCLQLERESRQLSDSGLVAALLACTRLSADPWSTLMVRLVSECQVRLGRQRLPAALLCQLGEALLALEGPSCVLLNQVMEQLCQDDPAGWSVEVLVGVYGLLQAGVGAGEDGRQQLLNAINTHAVTLVNRLDSQAVSAILGALVALNQSQATPLVIALCKQSVRYVARFTDEQLAAVLGSLMHFGHSDRFFTEAVERHVPQMTFSAQPETLAKVMQYFGRRRILSPPVFDAVAESFVYRADDYTTSQVARQVMPFGKLAYLPPNAAALFRKVEAVLHARFSQFQPRTMLNLLHACTLVERYPLNFVAKVFNSYFLQQLQEQGTGMDRVVLSQLTQLYMTVKLECPFYEGPSLLRKYRVRSFLTPGRSLETAVDGALYNSVKAGLLDLLGAHSYFSSRVLTPFCYTLDAEIKLDEEGYVLPASNVEDVYRRIAVCIDGPKRFSVNTRRLLGKEEIKQRHLKLLGYEVVQIPFYEFDELENRTEVVQYLHKKIFPHSYRLTW